MIRLFSPETFRDFKNKPAPAVMSGNGDMILCPTECYYEAEAGGTWKVTMTHPYDDNGKYNYIKKDAILGIDARICREQASSIQYFRINTVRPQDEEIEVIAYPIAWDSIHEVPINKVDYKNQTLAQIVSNLNTLYPQKYYIDLRYNSGITVNILAENSNLQEIINGNQDASIKNLWGADIVYDNYNYRILDAVSFGNGYSKAKDNKFLYGVNIAGIDIEESVNDTVTRIIPVSYEGYTIRNNPYVDSVNHLHDHPIVFARSIKYDDVKLVDEQSEDDKKAGEPATYTQYVTEEAKAAIKASVRSLSEKYLRKARAGNWDHNFGNMPDFTNNPHDPGKRYNEGKDRAALPYGYLFWSYTDAIGVLTQKVLDNYITDQSEYNVFKDAIKEGFKWCETTEIAGWDWRYTAEYDDDTYNFLKTYKWLKDDVGWWYGDGQGNYLTNAWVEDAPNKHYWVGSDGYWQPQWDDFDTWTWWTDSGGKWYGTKDSRGRAKNYAKEQYIYCSGKGNWYWFNGDGYFVDGSVKKWWYGTADGSDYVKFCFWKVDDKVYWFDGNGYVDTTLAYMDDFEWRSDENGYYYGDGKGHWMKSCWIEDSASKHYWVDEDGYWDEEKDDSNSWSWHGSWESGWWYGTSDDDEDESSGTNTSTSLSTIISNIQTILNNQASYTVVEFVDGIQDECDKKEHTSKSTLGKIEAKLSTTKAKSTMVSEIQAIIDDYNSSSTDSDTSPSGSEDESTPLNYAKNQFLYVTENRTWYWFDKDGYMVAAWMTDASWAWDRDGTGWWYGDNEGTFPMGQWYKINGHWYFFKPDGYADETTDDFNASKTNGSESASYDSNREGIGDTSTEDEDDEGKYDENREGVKAWIQKGFIKELKTVITQQHTMLLSAMEEQLASNAVQDLSYMDIPTVTITVDLEQLYNTQNYEKFSFLRDVFLGDCVWVYSIKNQFELISRINAIKYDCINKKVVEVTLVNDYEDYTKTKLKTRNSSWINNMANSNLHTSGKIEEYHPKDALEDGYGGFIKTGYGVDLTTL